jgi:hypothetical protein
MSRDHKGVLQGQGEYGILMAMQGKRLYWHDYKRTGFYMVTLSTAPRRPLFGTCRDNQTDLSPEGLAVCRHWRLISERDDRIETSMLIVMPDHLHGILFVKKPLEQSIGAYIRGFKSGVTSELRKLQNDSTLQVWEPGYHQVIALNQDTLQACKQYIRDNPRRYCLKKMHPDLFVRLEHLDGARLPKVFPPLKWVGFGNSFLLEAPYLHAIQVSRSVTDEALSAFRDEVEEASQKGAVCVSPFISPGEQAIVEDIVRSPHGRVIVLKHAGFPPLYKPGTRYFDLCAQGRVLILSPYPYTTTQPKLSRERCLEMNAMVAHICRHGDDAMRGDE